MKNLLAKILITATIALISMHTNAGEITPINDINTSPVSFEGKEVKLRGITKDPTRIPLLNLKSYAIEDNSGEIAILTDEDLPNMNEKITIRVRIESLAIIKGKSLGLTVVELERYKQ